MSDDLEVKVDQRLFSSNQSIQELKGVVADLSGRVATIERYIQCNEDGLRKLLEEWNEKDRGLDGRVP